MKSRHAFFFLVTLLMASPAWSQTTPACERYAMTSAEPTRLVLTNELRVQTNFDVVRATTRTYGWVVSIEPDRRGVWIRSAFPSVTPNANVELVDGAGEKHSLTLTTAVHSPGACALLDLPYPPSLPDEPADQCQDALYLRRGMLYENVLRILRQCGYELSYWHPGDREVFDDFPVFFASWPRNASFELGLNELLEPYRLTAEFTPTHSIEVQVIPSRRSL